MKENDAKENLESIDPDILTIAQVAQLLSITRQSVYSLINKGSIAGRRVGKRWRFSRRAIIDWVDGRGEGDKQ